MEGWGAQTLIVLGSLKVINNSRNSKFILDTSVRQDTAERITSEKEDEEKGRKKSNKFRGSLADIMSICHLVLRAV